MNTTNDNQGKGANIGNFADQLNDNVQQRANQYVHLSTEKQTLAKYAHAIQHLLDDLEKSNPLVTQLEQVAYINDVTPSTFKRRIVSSLRSMGEAAIDEFLENNYLKVIKAAINGWIKPEDKMEQDSHHHSRFSSGVYSPPP